MFSIGLHKKDHILLALFQKHFGVGKISYETGRDVVQYRVSSQKDLLKIINHFEKYPLITQKLADYKLFKQAFELVQRKEHLTEQGLRKLVSIKASINLGLSDRLKIDFPDVVPAVRPLVLDQKIVNPY